MKNRIGIICPSEIAFRRFLPALQKADDKIQKIKPEPRLGAFLKNAFQLYGNAIRFFHFARAVSVTVVL